jgi:hypothetical protein
MTRLPDSLLRRIDNWKFWMTVAFIALSCVVVWGVLITQQQVKLSSHQAREQAIALARVEADYRSCIRSIPSLRAISRHVSGVNDLARILVANNRALLHDSVARERPVRLANLHRLLRAERKVAAVQGFPVPTRASCLKRRRGFGG